MSAKKKIYIIAGEASGDLHAANLMKALLAEDDHLDFRFWGGDRMDAVAPGLVKHIKDLAFMGFLEVVVNLKTILGNIRFCKQDITAFKPDVLILVDYPGFNLRIASWAHEQGIAVHYYISPQVWAWKQSRVKTIRKVVDQMYVILPFEQDFYKKHGMDVLFVGHPLLDAIDDYYTVHAHEIEEFKALHQPGSKEIIALLPGSRKQEVRTKLPIMLEAVKGLDRFQIVIAGAPSLDDAFYRSLVGNDVHIVYNQTYALLANAKFALVTSGTATLETALFKVPELVCYKGSSISYAIAKRLVKVPFISLVNLIMEKEVVKELIQNECTAANIRRELDQLISDDSYVNAMLKNYEVLSEKLGKRGASKKVAQSLLKTIE